MTEDRLGDRQTLEARRQIDRLPLVGKRCRSGGRHRGLAQQLLGEVHHPPYVLVGRIELEHREFRVMARTDALVAEIAIDLEHAFEPAHHQPLQIQLGGDPKIHVDIERLVVRDERACGGSTRNQLQHRRLDLEEALLGHQAPHLGHRARPDLEDPARGLVHDQVHVTLPVAHLVVGQPVELVGKRTQRLGQQAQLLATDRQLAAVGPEQHAARAHDVADVPVAEGLVRVGAGVVVGQEELDPSGSVLQRGKAHLALQAPEHQAARHRDRNRLALELLAGGLGMARVQLGGAIGADEIVRVGRAALAQARELGTALGHDRMDRLDVARVRFGHGTGHTPCFRLALMNSSRSPSSTDCVLPISTLVRRSLIRD